MGQKKTMPENGENTDAKPHKKRDEKGRFLPGSKGGPGRGKKKHKAIDDLDIEAGLKKDMRSRDYKQRHQAIKLYMAWIKMRMETEEPGTPVIGPAAQKIIDAHCLDLLDDLEIVEDEYLKE
jgi:hypothetical protein